MSKYDKEREALGLKSVGTTTKSETHKQSKYSKERRLLQLPEFDLDADFRKTAIAKQKLVHANRAQDEQKLSITLNKPADKKAKAVIPAYNSKSPFYNTPIIGDMLKKDEEKTRETAAKVLNDKELDILAKGLTYELKSENMPGGITQKYFKPGQNVPKDVSESFDSVWQKVEYAKKSKLEKVSSRIGRKAAETYVGDKSAQEYAEATGQADAGKVGNVVGDIAGTILGYAGPSGTVGNQTMIGASNKLGENAIMKLTSKIPALAKHPLVSRTAQGLIEDIPLTAYTAMAEGQTPKEAVKTYAEQAPYSIGGELLFHGLGKAGAKIGDALAAKKATKTATGTLDNIVDVAKKYKAPETNQLPSAKRLLLPEKATGSLEAPSVPLTQYEKKLLKTTPQTSKATEKLKTLAEKQRQQVASQTGSKVLPEQPKKLQVPEQYKKEMPRRVTSAEIESTKGTVPEVKKLNMPEPAKTSAGQAPTPATGAKQAQTPLPAKAAQEGIQKLKTSKFRTNTIERSTMIPDDIKKKLKPEDYDFVPETSKEWQDNAVKNIETDRAKVVKGIKEADSISGGTQAHEAAIITEELVAKAKNGDEKELLEWLPTVAEKTRETARGLKGTDTGWEKSPADALIKAQRTLDNAVPDDVARAVKSDVKAAKKVLDEVNKVNANSVDDVFKDFLSEKPKVTKALREYLDKQETAATQRIRDYFKPTDGVIKMRAGPPGEILTDLATVGAAKLARKTLDFADWSVEMINEFGEKVKPYLKQIFDKSNDLIKSKSLKAPASSIDKTIRKVMSENGVKIQDIARKHVSEIDATGQTLAQKFVAQLGLSEEAAAKVEKIFVQRMKDMTTTKKQQILDQMFKPRKASQRKALSDRIIELSNMGAIGDEKYAKVLKEKYNIPELNADDVQRIIKQSEEIQGMTDVFKRQAATNKMMADIQKKIPSTFGSKVKAYTMVNTLLNPKTIGSRNILGNITQGAAMRVNKAFLSAIDFTASKLTGAERKVTFKTNRGLANVVKDFFSDVKIGGKAGWEGYNPYGTISEFRMATQAFQGKYDPLTYLEKALGASLSGAGDYPFYMKAVMDSVGEQSVLRAMNEGYTGKALKAQAKVYADEVINSAKNISDFSKRVLDVANRAGEKATFRDANVISAVLSGVHDTLNIAGIGKHKPTIGKIASREFGLGDMVIMFAKTPGALLNIGLEYSPLGVVKSGLEMLTGITKASKENVTESIVKAVSGTLLLTGTGYYLTAKGAMKGKAPSDKEAREFFDENGQKEYSFNTDAIVRWVKGGFKDESLLKPQDGDKWYTYDWLSPFAFNVGLGANVAQEGVKLNTLKALPDTLGASMKMFAENDALSGLLDKNYKEFDERLINTLVSMPSRFVPLGSIVNQVRQMKDNTKRNTASDDPKQKAINLLKNRIPGLSEQLPAVLTTTGEVKEMYAGGSNNPLNVLLSPGYLGIYKTSPGRELLKNLYKSTGKTSQFPKLQTNKIKIYGTEYPLSNDQKADLQKYVGQMTWSTLDSLVTAKSNKGKEFADLDDEIKLKVISNLMEEIGNKAELYMANKLKIKKPTKQETKDKKVEIPKFKMAN